MDSKSNFEKKILRTFNEKISFCSFFFLRSYFSWSNGQRQLNQVFERGYGCNDLFLFRKHKSKMVKYERLANICFTHQYLCISNLFK